MGKTENKLADITHWIAGRRVGGMPVRTSEVFNPATGDVTENRHIARKLAEEAQLVLPD